MYSTRTRTVRRNGHGLHYNFSAGLRDFCAWADVGVRKLESSGMCKTYTIYHRRHRGGGEACVSHNRILPRFSTLGKRVQVRRTVAISSIRTVSHGREVKRNNTESITTYFDFGRKEENKWSLGKRSLPAACVDVSRHRWNRRYNARSDV